MHGVKVETILEEAKRQLKAMRASGASSVRWIVPEVQIQEQLIDLFVKNRLNIEVVVVK